ncbi:type VI secretion system accessory protein TagJ [Andreprevotia sp. IGB-42]|uniref:type VI secretion system accessory protein TagJ n=1 Tax=Andreprevotia sp. IGB-42 TaxID=2497473 RepID=UPI00135B2D67|nr:type VI secretion system accessory protein TagJ [Andreprevotia sp. IGB-42]
MTIDASAKPVSLAEELGQIEARIRQKPNDADLRAHLFQILALLGDWQRAQAQLQLCLTLNPDAISLVRGYGSALKAELVRAAVFAGKAVPQLPNDPPAWLPQLVEALHHDVQGRHAEASVLRDAAWALAPVAAGILLSHDGAGPQPYQWLADGDSRFGPVLEFFAGERYHWLPLSSVAGLRLSRPISRCDLVWAHAALTLHDGSETAVILPVRYPLPAQPAALPQDECLLSRYTEWEPLGGDGHYQGRGQRMWASDQNEYALLDLAGLQATAEVTAHA